MLSWIAILVSSFILGTSTVLDLPVDGAVVPLCVIDASTGQWVESLFVYHGYDPLVPSHFTFRSVDGTTVFGFNEETARYLLTEEAYAKCD